MSKMKQVFVSPSNGLWKVKTAGKEKAAGIFPNKPGAVKKGIEMAKNQKAELRIQNSDGKISQSNSYGHDPHKIKG